MKSFDEWRNAQRTQVNGYTERDAFEAGQQSKQAEVDELRKRLTMYERESYKLVPVSELQKYVNSIRHYNNSGDYDRIEYDLTSIENVFTKP